jgi:hypothetical protein
MHTHGSLQSLADAILLLGCRTEVFAHTVHEKLTFNLIECKETTQNGINLCFFNLHIRLTATLVITCAQPMFDKGQRIPGARDFCVGLLSTRKHQ